MLNVTSLYFMSKFGFKLDAMSSLFFSRLYVLQGGLAQQEWRVPELLHRLLQYLEPKLTQVYKNVRERIGRYVLQCKNQVNIICFFFVCFCLSHCDSFFLSSCPVSQCAHLHLHDWCEPATLSAHHIPAHRRVHGACAGQAQAFNGGRGGDPEPRGRGEHRGRSRREDTSHQITQNWCVLCMSFCLCVNVIVWVCRSDILKIFLCLW